MARPLVAALLALSLAAGASAQRPRNMVAPAANAALDAFIADRYVATVRPGMSADAVAALQRGVAAKTLRGADAGTAHAPETSNAALGVVSFKFTGTPASPQAADQVRVLARARGAAATRNARGQRSPALRERAERALACAPRR